MRSNVTVVFNPRQTLEWPVEFTPDRQASEAARSWFEKAWEELGCEPLRASGKVLLLDKILGVADALGYQVLSGDAARAAEFAHQVALALEKPRVTVDLPGLAITY